MEKMFGNAKNLVLNFDRLLNMSYKVNIFVVLFIHLYNSSSISYVLRHCNACINQICIKALKCKLLKKMRL